MVYIMYGLKLDNWQKEFLKTKGDKILCCGRQVGKSEICSMDAGNYAITHPNSQPIVMIAPTERQAYGLFDKTLQYLLNNHQKEVVTKGKKKPTKSRICLRNGVLIYCLPVGKSGLGIRFLTIGRLYVDEASRVPEDVWAAIEPALLTTGGAEILLSTPFGCQGEFYKVWINEDGAYDSFKRFSITSEVVMKERPICETWTKQQREKALNKLEQAKKRKSKREYAQEYLGEFVEDLYRYFADALIDNCCILKRRGRILPNKEYHMGCDIARMGADEGTIEILDRINDDTIEHVENIVTTKQLTNETEENIINVDNLYNCKSIAIDAGAGTLGVSVYDHLLIKEQTKRKIIAINNATRPLDRAGKYKTKILKEDLYDNLRALMEQGKIKLLDEDNVRESLKSVQYEYLMKAGEPSRLRIFGNYTHIVEGLIRAAWMAKHKSLNIWVRSFKV